MLTDGPPATPLRLDPIIGPALAPITVRAEASPVILGRSEDSGVGLSHETVSRRHASLIHRGGRWSLRDLGSRHGTFVSGIRLEPHHPSPLAEGDLVRLGPWTFRVSVGGDRRRTGMTVDDSVSGRRVERVPRREAASPAQQRLDLLIESAATMYAANDEPSLIAAGLDAVLAGCGFARAAWIRPGAADGGAVEVVATRGKGADAGDEFTFSRSLISEAAAGQLVWLTSDAPGEPGVSVGDLRIHTALCAPVMISGSITGFIYLDARGNESCAAPDAADFCQAVARICGLALANLKREVLEREHGQLENELAAAREAQKFVIPASEGTAVPVSYSLRTRPGMHVVGDLFNVVRIDAARVAVVMGDVAGEGIGAAIVMASCQSFLHAALERFGDAADAVSALNEYLTSRGFSGRFITLWVGLFEATDAAGAGEVRFVDAGHGHWLFHRAGEPPRRITTENGIPVGVEPNYPYRSERLALAPGDRLILFSDGLIEQRSSEGEQFGISRVVQALSPGPGVRGDVSGLFAAVETFASLEPGSTLHDDATAATIQWLGGRET